MSRSQFVPPVYEDLAEIDEPIPIGHHQTTSQPSLIAAMIDALGLKGTEKVLEIGTGYGYQTALLSHLSAEVWSVEWWDDLAEAARLNLWRSGVVNATVVTGDGTEGLPDHAPFDAIVVSAAFPTVPPPLVAQLVGGGRLVQPIGPSGDEDVTLFVKEETGLRRVRIITRAQFVPLVAALGVE